jgi:DNA-binding phage protein
VDRIQVAKVIAAYVKKRRSELALIRDSAQTVVDRAKRDRAFAKALFDEAVGLFLDGEPETARLALRDLVKATVGFEQLATETGKPAKSLHRMLSTRGNPSMGNLSVVLGVLRQRLGMKHRSRPMKAA